MVKEQLEQIDNGFKFILNDEEVVVTGVNTHTLDDANSEVRLCTTEGFTIVGPFKKSVIVQYLEETGQEQLLSREIISAGQYLVDMLGLNKINIGANKGLYELSDKHWTHGGPKPKSLLEIGQVAIDSVLKRDFSTWLHTLNRINNT